METLYILSQLLFLLAIGGALYMLVRYRDWRLGFLAFLVIMMQAHPHLGGSQIHLLVMSLAACSAIYFLETALRLRAQTTRELLRARQRFDDFVELTSDWTWELDEDLRFKKAEERVRQRLLSRTGMNFDLVIGETRWEHAGIDHPEGNEIWQPHYEDMVAHREFRDFRYTFVDAGRRARHVKISGRPEFDDTGQFRGYYGVGTDETAEVESRLSSERAEAQLRDAIDSIPSPTLLLDAEDRIALFNDSWRQWYPGAADAVTLGTRYEDMARYISDTGLWDEMGPREIMLEDRLQRHRAPPGRFEQQLSRRPLHSGERKPHPGRRLDYRSHRYHGAQAGRPPEGRIRLHGEPRAAHAAHVD